MVDICRSHEAAVNDAITLDNTQIIGKIKSPNQKNIYGAALALIAIMYGIKQGIIAVASLLATMALYGNGRDPQ